MTPWFTNSWLRLGGSKKRAQQYKDENDKENEGSSYPSYPKNKKAKKTEVKPVEATPSDAGSWFLCQDREGRMYWWNDVTGQWTYQLYSPEQQQHNLQQQQMMYPSMHHHHHGLSFSHQQPHHVYSPTSFYGHQYSPSAMVPSPTSPHMYVRHQHQPWSLVSPSTAASSHGSGGIAGGRGLIPATAAIGGFGLGWGIASSSSDDGEDGEDEEQEEEEEAEEEEGKGDKKEGEEEEDGEEEEEEEDAEDEEETGTWDKFFDSNGIPVWIHSETGARTMLNPALAL